MILTVHHRYYVEIKYQLDATDDIWACNKICNKYHLLHLVGTLFPQNKLISYEVYKAVDISVKCQRNSVKLTQVMLGPIGCPETLLRNYHYTLRNIPEDRRSQGDPITMVTLQLHSSETFFSWQASFRLLTSSCSQFVPSPPFLKPQANFHTVRSHVFEGHLYTVSFIPDQSAITTWWTLKFWRCGDTS